MYEVNIPTDMEKQGTDQSDSEDSLGVFIGSAVERDFYQQYGEHKEFL